ncbi:MAG TPA: hypothetical protein VJV04_07070 [Nitrospiraceae bacterium]|nr:hypothetical protein [Nitrospiraceae bacterium]
MIGSGIGLLFIIPLLASFGFNHALASDWTVVGGTNVFYTNDVTLFSASRRLSLRDDPTQPVVDVTGQGNDMVSEPLVEIVRSFSNRWAPTDISVKSQGYIFARNPLFNHGSVRVRVGKALDDHTRLRLYYFALPDLFLARNTEHRSGRGLLMDERVTTNFWSAHLERDLLPGVAIRLLTRYGVRDYNQAFAERNTHFWTVGPHVDWEIRPWLSMTIGYHYERGLATGRHDPQFADDVSYINHYVSTEWTARFSSKMSLKMAFHYENNIFTSNLIGDRRRGGTEEVYQADVQWSHRLNDAWTASVGFQRSQRHITFEEHAVIDWNALVGLQYRYESPG